MYKIQPNYGHCAWADVVEIIGQPSSSSDDLKNVFPAAHSGNNT